jgi:hypothetical protein
MSIISAIKEAQHDDQNLEDLAKLPQYLIMNMVQRGEIKEYMLTPILGKKAEMADQAAKMQAAEQLAAQGGAMPTVMEQNMGKIAQAENPAPPMPQQQMQEPMQQPMPQQMAQAPMPQGPEDVGIATQATQPMSLAGGGIIAFEGGGDVDDDEEDRYDRYKRKAKSAADFSAIGQMIANIEQGAGSGYSENRGVGIKADSRGAERGMVGDADQARKHNVGNLRPSGFSYPGQVGTSKGGFAMFDNPESGIKALQHDINIKLNRGLDTPTKFISVYAPAGDKNDVGAYSKNVANMLGIKPNDKIPNTPEARQLLAQAIIRQEGAHKATAAFAQGGIAHFATGDAVEEEEPESYLGSLFKRGFIPEFGTKSEADKKFAADYIANQKLKQRQQEALTSSDLDIPFYKAVKPSERKLVEDKRKAILNGNLPPVSAAPAKTTTAPTRSGETDSPQLTVPQNAINVKGIQDKADEEAFNLMQYIKDRQARMDKAADQDKWQAGLAAGLGMLGGTSQYAFENIGKGGQMGVQQLAQSQKTRAAQEKALGELYGEGAKIDLMSKTRKDALAQAGSTKYGAEVDKINTARTALEKKYLDSPKYMQLATLPQLLAKLRKDPSNKDLVTQYNALQELQSDLEAKIRRDLPDPNPALYGVSGGGGGGMKIVGVRG